METIIIQFKNNMIIKDITIEDCKACNITKTAEGIAKIEYETVERAGEILVYDISDILYVHRNKNI